MSKRENAAFYVGYLNSVPRPLALFLLSFAAIFLGAAIGLAFSLGASIDDPGNARFVFEEGRQKLVGRLRLDPYPVLHLPAHGDQSPRAILLSGPGKRGAGRKVAGLDGELVEIGGAFLRRGNIDMLQMPGRNAVRRLDENEAGSLAGYQPTSARAFGRWRLTGEICDGKCEQGAMRPGRGLAHKACANLCLIGGAPPVFVSSGSVDGESYFLLADSAGGPLPEEVYDLVALVIEVEGEVERRDNLMVFRIDLDTVRVP